MVAVQPLSTLLSQALVAFTIEFDNEFEHQMPHRTTSQGGSRQGPWLVSLAMWSNCMQYVAEEGVTLGELEDLARTTTNLNGMERWGYIAVEPKRPRANSVIRSTHRGRQAQQIWRPLFGVIEKRWQERIGKQEIAQLRESLGSLISRVDVELPDCLPILGYGLFSKVPAVARAAGDTSRLPLSAFLSRCLLAFAIEFERESDLSLAISANVARVLDETGVRVRDLPLLTGVSKEAISVALGFLQKRHAVVVEPDQAGSRVKVARLTPKGREAQTAYHQLLGSIEKRWEAHFGKDAIRSLWTSLERLAGDSTAQASPLFRGLEPYPDGWRASIPKPSVLPHYPMVLHRGGFPDGS
jgi:DNA-binding MarR family transcriptional regulator